MGRVIRCEYMSHLMFGSRVEDKSLAIPLISRLVVCLSLFRSRNKEPAERIRREAASTNSRQSFVPFVRALCLSRLGIQFPCRFRSSAGTHVFVS